jgi:hypothetical protein
MRIAVPGSGERGARLMTKSRRAATSATTTPARAWLIACLGALALPVIACDEGDLGGPEIVLGANYRKDFTKVRTCRFSVEHDLSYMQVWANAEAAALYEAGPYPFRAGAVIVKEQFSDANCVHLSGYTLMKKGGAGTDSRFGDWRWYRLDDDFRIVEDGSKTSRCGSCHAQPACRARDFACAEP